MERHQDLAFEIRRIHAASKVTVIPIVISALGNISENTKAWYGTLDLPDIFGSIQLLAILGSEMLTCCGKCCVSKLRGVAKT